MIVQKICRKYSVFVPTFVKEFVVLYDKDRFKYNFRLIFFYALMEYHER